MTGLDLGREVAAFIWPKIQAYRLGLYEIDLPASLVDAMEAAYVPA
jgi:hypothetical protein